MATERLAGNTDSLVSSQVLKEVSYKNLKFPIYCINIGSQDKTLPCLGLFAGVHGMENVGTHVLLSFLRSFFVRMGWDQDIRQVLESCRIVCIPIVNPVGMYLRRRSNGNGVDLMRNSPVMCDNPSLWPIGGQRLSPHIPWYQGKLGELELENQVLVDFVKEQMFSSECAMALDFHSGFGMKDRLWYPYAKTTTPFPHVFYAKKIKSLFEQTFPYHPYKVESQSTSYTTHGDIWDYLFDMHYEKFSTQNKIFIPWALEMGSWRWVKKNPLQIMTGRGFFNPIKKHRHRRTMRRHLLLVNFFFRIIRNYKFWFNDEDIE